MKTLIMAAVIAVASTGAVYAEGLTDPVFELETVAQEELRWNEGLHYTGYSYYEVEAETWTTKAGISYGIDRLTLATYVELEDSPWQEFGFVGMDFRVDYAITDQITTFGVVSTDEDFKYDEATFGVAWFF